MGEITKTAADLIAWQKVRIEELEAALQKYGQHQKGCQFAPFQRVYAFSEAKREELRKQGCTCGLDAARKWTDCDGY